MVVDNPFGDFLLKDFSPEERAIIVE